MISENQSNTQSLIALQGVIFPEKRSPPGDLTLLFDFPEAVIHKYFLKPYRQAYAPILCSWITSREKLQLVSSDEGEGLNLYILNSWIDKAVGAFVVENLASQPVGFFTLSCIEETRLREGDIELCHLIINPHRKYFSTGSFICLMAHHFAHNLGYRRIIGRIVHRNRYGHALALHHKYLVCVNYDFHYSEEFIWVEHLLTEKDIIF